MIDQRRFQSLFTELLSKSPKKLTVEELNTLLADKKRKVGGGYLTDQGALFLVAADLGVALDYNQHSSSSNSNILTRLSDIVEGQTDIQVLVRVLSMSVPKIFARKNDSSKTGLLQRLVVYDNAGTVSVNFWNDKAASLFEGAGIKLGDLIRIKNAYSKPNLDGSIALNMGEDSSIEIVSRENQSTDIPEIKQLAVLPESVSVEGKFPVVQGKVATEVKKSDFTKKDGTLGALASFGLASPSNKNAQLRVVIWQNSNPAFLNLRSGEDVTLLNLKARISNFSGPPTLELHGDDATCILEYWEETKHWMRKSVGSITINETGDSKINNQQKRLQISSLPFIARILSIGSNQLVEGSRYLLLIDSQKRKLQAVLTGEAMSDLDNLGVDDLVICKPESVDYLALKAFCTKSGSIARVGAKRQDIPTSSSLVSQIENLESGSIVSLEAMSLSDSSTREISTTKDGLVRRSELALGDPTGEIKIYAWRIASKLLENIRAGSRLWFSAVEAQSHEGKKFLNLKNYSTVEQRENY